MYNVAINICTCKLAKGRIRRSEVAAGALSKGKGGNTVHKEMFGRELGGVTGYRRLGSLDSSRVQVEGNCMVAPGYRLHGSKEVTAGYRLQGRKKRGYSRI